MTAISKKRVVFTAAVLLAFIAWCAGLSIFIKDVASLSPPIPSQKLQAIVVLTGGSNRVDTGFNLLEQGFGEKLFISGVYRGIDVNTLLKRWKDEPQSSLDCCVALGFEAGNTVGNASESIEWLRKEGFHSLYLVTANYHMRRALLEFSRVAPDFEITPFPVVPDRFDATNWRDPMVTGLLVREYIKYLVAALRSWL